MLTLKRVFSNNESKGYPILEFLITASIIALAFSLILSQITLAKNNIPKSVETNIKLDLKQSMPIISKNEKYEVKLSASDYEVKLASQKATAKKKERIEILARSNEGRAEGISFDQKRALVKTTAQKFGIDWKILEAVWQVESGKSWDTSKKSYAGAQGPMQFMPGTFRAYAEDGDGDGKAQINDTSDALASAAKMLSQNGLTTGDSNRALFNYNHSMAYVNQVKGIASSIVE
ncbi:hypothetical protein CO101_03070 [Candidatus Berkelbacteria bacterium CG_4_9_14_3_um_filter_39_23]|uniref:Transglycosylase SLT domain-containing protein n=2 Tax=Candidatus Berkelbacteria TaxID=1618330 RepID=A0A2M7CHH7_9BACT|nr:lytic transglycosylase domain-containing protein [Candidatus Berkelbacteria bacterium]OIP05618.1 MAG: hypothetical protein AUK14_01415 [Candidatus Berkelbacteria bacterium CG2_30_39_44]PIR27778.1 MAG: hypothetical protein COV39_02675 [Candidatus Berkelbacteria bacterium CG11_big_fil_rev_8_21_14_0_20_40_23]PIV25093.1 MAG: hypothetical protein COS38_03450 [Candidatus Berkelbacteria bacterium CG03_land_8_20_14_0_80_40_36]PIX30906.1 MAG: hypothetical protein COZ62_00070 [Candidatus Berkelbacteri